MAYKKIPFLCASFFFVSGAAALIYEVIWVRLLGLVFGNTTFAVSTVLSAYMAGLGVGSFYFGRLADRWQKSIRAYAFLEIGIGVYAAFTPFLLALLTAVYISSAKAIGVSFVGLTALRLFFSFFIVFIPTFMMGGTLPILAKYFERQKAAAGSNIAFLYGLNTIGAVVGTAAGGFWLLPILGVKLTVWMAVILNIGIGCLALALSTEEDEVPAKSPSSDKRPSSAKAGSLEEKSLFVSLFTAGAIAMIFEVCWTRTLATVLNSSTYSFTLMLVTFLLGFGLGSMAWKRVLAKRAATFADVAWLAAGISFFSLAALPMFPWVSLLTVRLHALTIDNFDLFQWALFAVCGALMMLPSFLFGGLFPVTTDLYARHSPDFSRKIGSLYLTNTLGNVLGSLTAGFLFIPLVGIYRSLCLASAIAALLALSNALVAQSSTKKKNSLTLFASGILILASILMMFRGWDARLLTSGINLRPNTYLSDKSANILARIYDVQVLSYREGLHAIVSVGQYGDDRHIKVNGKADASTKEDMPTQALLAHLPHMLHPNPKESLVVGYGSGVTLAAALAYPVTRVDCVEIEPAVLEAAPYFDSVNRKTYLDPRAKLIVNDGRNHLLMTDTPYDIIISEPSNPWMAGVANLFSVEYYRLVDKRLKSDGIFCQWVQSYGIAPEDFQMAIASLRTVFPHVTLWHSSAGDYLMVAGKKPLVFDYAQAQRYFELPLVQKDMEAFEIKSPAGLLAHFYLGEKDLDRLVQGAFLNTDDKLLLEFNTPRTLFDSTSPIIRDILNNVRTEQLPPMINIDPPLKSQPSLLAEMGNVYLTRQNLTDARTVFELALSLDPANNAALIGMGRLFGNEKKWHKANEYFSKAASAEGLAYWGWTLHLSGDDEGAREKLKQATESPDAKWEHFFWKGQIAEEFKDGKSVIEAYQAALRLAPDNLAVRIAFGKALYKIGQPKLAVQHFEKLRSEFPTYYPIYSDLRESYIASGDLSSAIKIYKDYLAINPYSTNAWLNLGKLYAKAGNETLSFQASDKAYSLDRFAS